ncbi:hypothetical protein MKK88_03360 [Methylobacterium sp. E-005]|nr:hypothetical protein [Methylobacterium sp. E-005]MCJ2085034.1 hypothetical protein [Methylobacterium sp. E-005]
MHFLTVILEALRGLPTEKLVVLVALASLALAAYVVHVMAGFGPRP